MGAAPFAPADEPGAQRLGWAVAHLPQCPPERREPSDPASPDNREDTFEPSD